MSEKAREERQDVLHTYFSRDIARRPHRTQGSDRLARRIRKYPWNLDSLATLSDPCDVWVQGEEKRFEILFSETPVPKAEFTFQD